MQGHVHCRTKFYNAVSAIKFIRVVTLLNTLCGAVVIVQRLSECNCPKIARLIVAR